MKKIAILLSALLPLLAMGQRGNLPQQQAPSNPHNVIFVIGDGMGTAQVYSSIVAQKEDNSVFLQFPYTGFSRTYSHNRYTTDSGAGGTALMTGRKVDNNHIGLTPQGTNAYSILTVAKETLGKSVGFVVTSSVLDATPASTYGHVSDRKKFDSLSMQMAQCGFDVMIGGGYKSFKSQNRTDGLAPIDTLAAHGYQLAFTTLDMMMLRSDKICALLSDDGMPQAPERGRALTLGTLKAIEVLSNNDNGFALMVEGSQIDWACHNNDSAYLAAEMADFEEMLRAVLDFARRDGNTLVVVTADHETGGLTLPNGNIEEGTNVMRWATSGHTGCMVPVFAYGPGAEQFAGIQQNTDFWAKIVALLSQSTDSTKRK